METARLFANEVKDAGLHRCLRIGGGTARLRHKLMGTKHPTIARPGVEPGSMSFRSSHCRPTCAGWFTPRTS